MALFLTLVKKNETVTVKMTVFTAAHHAVERPYLSISAQYLTISAHEAKKKNVGAALKREARTS